jgi:hypothetical protein
MKRYLLSGLLVLSAFLFISWGFVGHKAVATIAENHLTSRTKEAIRSILGDMTIADIASWADGVRNQPRYAITPYWHYLNQPTGLTRKDFENNVYKQNPNNIYAALLKSESVLQNPAATTEQKKLALMFVVHLVGDIHQPMQISRKEDRGGNTIIVKFEDSWQNNLHEVWDNKLIQRWDVPFDQMVTECDTASARQIKKWQDDRPMDWLWESYVISSRLYKEAAINNKLSNNYYAENIPIVKQRLEMAGVRLAGVLNAVFANNAGGSVSNSAIPNVTSKLVEKNIGKEVSVTGTVYDGRFIESNHMTVLYIGNQYPHQDFDVVIQATDRAKFGEAPELEMKGKTIKVTGFVTLYRSSPQIMITNKNQLEVVDAPN